MEIKQLQEQVIAFRDSRDWEQFHNLKDTVLSLNLEASELLEIFQWKDSAEIEDKLPELRTHIGEELSDILYWLLLIAHDAKIDLTEAFVEKLKVNEEKYPIDKVKGRKNKYTDYEA